jgi:hypothetical protein
MNEINKKTEMEISIEVKATKTDGRKHKLVYRLKNWSRGGDDRARSNERPRKRKLTVYCNIIMLKS